MHESQSIRVAIDKDNPSIERIEELCIRCGQCKNICNDFVSVNNHYDLESTGQQSVCVNCGQCVKVCPVDSLVGKDEFPDVEKAIMDEGKVVREIKVKVAVVFGLENTRKIIDKMKAGVQYHFIEIMTCPGGCIGGGGQPKHLGEEETAQKARIHALYERDKSMECRASHTNPEIIQLYKEYLIKPGSELAEELLHTVYTDKSEILQHK